MPAAWDIFLSHATEDKESIARPLALALISAGLHVWFDEFTLLPGDSLRRSIDNGLAKSRYGVIILSRSYLAKQWTTWELDGLVQMAVSNGNVLLPIWHDITAAEVRDYSPSLADKIAIPSTLGVDAIATRIFGALQ